MGAGEPQAEWYASINPNGRMPALVHVKDDGTSVTVFESGACLLYIASEFDKEHKLSYPIGTPEYWTQLSWVSKDSRDIRSSQLTSSLIALMANCRLRPYDGSGSVLLSLCHRISAFRGLALHV